MIKVLVFIYLRNNVSVAVYAILYTLRPHSGIKCISLGSVYHNLRNESSSYRKCETVQSFE